MASPSVPSSNPDPFPDPVPRPASSRRRTPEDWEQLRRSVAMLPPRAWALRREEALQILQSLVSCLRRR